MPQRKLTKVLLLAASALVASCATREEALDTSADTPLPYCSAGGPTCSVEDALLATLDVLGTNRDVLSVSCEKRIDMDVDGPYMMECKRRVSELASSLSSRFAGHLAPIDTRTIRYHWKAWDCISGSNFGFCRGYGMARIPLRWIAVPPGHPSPSTPLRGSNQPRR